MRVLLALLNESVLGVIYRAWISSAVFALLRRCHGAVVSALRQSAILGFVFGESRADRAFGDSFAARIIRWITALLVKICAWIVSGIRGSCICRALAPLVEGSAILKFDFLFGAFLCVMFLVPHVYWNNLWFVLAAVGFTGLFLLLAGAGKRRAESPDFLGFWFFLFVLACVLSMLTTTAFSDSLRILLFFLASFAVCWLIAVNYDEPASLHRLMAFLYVALLVVSALGIAQRLLNLVSVNNSYTDTRFNAGVPGRVFATLYNPNNLSGFIQMFLPLGAAFAAGADRDGKRVPLCVGLVIPAVALVMTYSRAGWISIALAAAVFTYCCNKRLIPALVVLAIACVPFLPHSVLTRLSTITNSEDSSMNHRFAIWTGVLEMLKQYWVTGVGLGPDTFQNCYEEYAYGIAKLGAYHTQMLYMELLVETGIFGFISFFWMMFKYGGRMGRAVRTSCGDRRTRLVLVAGLSALVGLSFSAIVEYLWFYQRCMYAFFIFFGILLAALRSAEKNGKNALECPCNCID